MNTLATLAMGAFTQPAVTWDIPGPLQNFCRSLAFVLIVAWIAYIIAQYAMPSKRQGRVKWGRVAVMGFGSLLLLDLSTIPLIVNQFLRLVWAAGHLFFPTYFATI